MTEETKLINKVVKNEQAETLARPRLFIFFHVDVLRATTGFLAEVTARRRWRLAVSFRISTGLQTDFNRPG